MIFSSMVFIWAFLPIVLTVNYILGKLPASDETVVIRRKNRFLLIASLVFYAWGGVQYLLIMLGVIVVSYLGGQLMAKGGKLTLVLTIGIELEILIVFKYANMIAGIFHAKNWTEIALPVGISFFTFQAMSYVIDVYRNNAEPARNILDLALYISLFPQLIAGPIVRYGDIEAAIRLRSETPELFLSGIRRFCYGLAKKVLIANTIAEVSDNIWNMSFAGMDTAVAWMGLITYSLQIYYDFSGYSDMAIGIGRMLGFEFKENFDHPYTSLSVREFWRRWHMSLSGWFKEYVYIPLGGNRKGEMRTCINLMMVFLLTGLWHGAGTNYVLWGAFHGIILVAERVFLGRLLDRNPIKVINVIYTGFLILISWVLFKTSDIGSALAYTADLFAMKGGLHKLPGLFSMRAVTAMTAGIIFMGPAQRLFKDTYEKIKNRRYVIITDYALQMVLLVLSIIVLAAGTYNPFIYYRF